MATATRNLGDGANEVSWRVRNDQGELFGPVDVATLRSWACDGRLAPTNEISDDGTTWKIATSLRELEMNWVVEITPGTFYGPIHRRAIEDLLKEGSVPATSSFFLRSGLKETAAPAASTLPADERARLLDEIAQVRREAADHETEVLGLARQRAAALEAEVRRVQEEAADREAGAHRVREQASAFASQVEQLRLRLTSQEEQAQRQCAAYEEQVRLLQQQAAASAAQEEEARRQLAVQTEQTHQLVARCEEQVRIAQQQTSEYAVSTEHFRRQSFDLEKRLNEALSRVTAQDELVRVAQTELVAKAESFAHEVALLRGEQSAALAKSAETAAQQQARALSLETQLQETQAQRRSDAEALKRLQSDLAARELRLAQVEKALSETSSSDSERSALSERIRSLSMEVVGLQQALEAEKKASQCAEARCASLQSALEAAKASRGADAALSDLKGELKGVRDQLEALREAVAQAATRSPRPEPVRVEAEPVDAEVVASERRAGGGSRVSHERTEWSRPASPAGGGRTSGLSMAELEQQARRELERLGAQGAQLFKKKR